MKVCVNNINQTLVPHGNKISSKEISSLPYKIGQVLIVHVRENGFPWIPCVPYHDDPHHKMNITTTIQENTSIIFCGLKKIGTKKFLYVHLLEESSYVLVPTSFMKCLEISKIVKTKPKRTPVKTTKHKVLKRRASGRRSKNSFRVRVAKLKRSQGQ